MCAYFGAYWNVRESTMAFTRFTQTGGRFRPIVSISKTGLISLNKGSARRFNVDECEAAILFYDADTNRIGIKPTNDMTEEGTCRLRKRESGADISGRSFLACFEIPHETTRRFNAVWDDEEEMIVLELDRIREEGTSR